MHDTRRLHAARALLRTLLVPLAATVAVLATPAWLAAQQQGGAVTTPAPALTRPSFEGYLSRVRTDPAVAGERARLAGLGARLLVPLRGSAIGGAPLRPTLLDRVADRVDVGGFVTYAPDGDRGLTAWHYGVQSDVRLLRAGAVRRVEPLLSLGVGAFRAQRGPGVAPVPAAVADDGMRRTDLPLVVGSGAAASTPFGTHFALSPALAARLWLLPDVALRTDAREVIVYDGAPRRVFELTTGLTFSR